ncbi:MAG: autoinducer binding domain-containing protein [Pseudomonadota bacterium]
MTQPLLDFHAAGEVLEVLTRLPSSQSRFDYFVDQIRAQGFTDVFYARLLPGASKPFLMRRWDTEWAEIYDAKRYAVWDWALSAGLTNDAPFLLRAPIVDMSPKQAAFYREAEAYNRLNGFAAPYHSATAGAAGFSATGLDREPTEGIMLSAAATGYVFNLSIVGQMASEKCEEAGVTPRQQMFLRLLGDGHTHVEIAELLGLSEDWAHKSFAKLREKFEVRTDPALIRRVMQSGLLT